METNKKYYVLGLLRIVMGFIFLWAFLDKLIGLGFATLPEKAMLVGGSATTGFLSFGVHGPFAEFFKSLAGVPLVDYLFMFDLLFLGISFMLGIFMRLAAIGAVCMLGLMYLAIGIPPENNPFIDDHIVYILVVLVLALFDSGKYLGFGAWWERTTLVGRHKLLK